MSKCVHCNEHKSGHSVADSCPIFDSDGFAGWHPSNRFTPSPIPSMTASEQIFGETAERAALPSVRKCSDCGQPYPFAHSSMSICPACLAKRNELAGKEASQAADTSIPPGCAPFDLAKALTEERLVTRDGRKAHSCRYCQTSSDCILVEIEGYGTFHYPLNGRSLGPDGADHPLDLFLAAKEEKSEAGPNCIHCDLPAVCHSTGYGGNCPALNHRKETCGWRTTIFTAPPTPETEARRQAQEELHAIHAEMAAREKACEELDRQIEVMRANENEIVRLLDLAFSQSTVCIVHPERKHPIPCEEHSEKKFCAGCALKRDLMALKNRIRPASPAPPRRVWVAVDTLGVLLHRTCTENSDDLIGYSAAEFIELAPEVRAKLGMGGEK